MIIKFHGSVKTQGAVAVGSSAVLGHRFTIDSMPPPQIYRYRIYYQTKRKILASFCKPMPIDMLSGELELLPPGI
jgi:hypothetical protein